MSTAKRRRLDFDTASNGSGRATSSRRTAAAGASRAGAGAASAAARAVQANTVAVNGNGAVAETGSYIPVLSLSGLPVAALSRYALHYNLIQPDPLTPSQATYPTPPLPLQLSLAPSTQPVFRRRASLIPERKIPENTNKELDGGPDAQLAQTPIGDGEVAPTDTAQMDLDRPVSGAANPMKQNGHTVAGIATAATTGSRNGSVAPSEVPAASSSIKQQQQQPLVNGKSRSMHWEDPGEPDAEELRGMTAYDGGQEQFRERVGGLARAHWERNQTVKEGETIINFAYAVRMRSKVLKSVPPP